MIFNNRDRKLKEAFSSIKQEMEDLRKELAALREELSYLTDSVESILDSLESKKEQEAQKNLEGYAKLSAKSSADVPRNVPNFTERFIKKQMDVPNFDLGTSEESSMHIPLNSGELSLKDDFSIGNKGVLALRQQIGSTQAVDPRGEDRKEGTENPIQDQSKQLQENVERLKRALHDSFKKLTKQEFVVFSTLYQMEDELKRAVGYSELAVRSNLTPNSLRDYVSKLIIKKVPIIKEKHNNKQILLKIAPELRNIETLSNLIRIVERQ